MAMYFQFDMEFILKANFLLGLELSLVTVCTVLCVGARQMCDLKKKKITNVTV